MRYQTNHFSLTVYLAFRGFEILAATENQPGRYLFTLADPDRRAQHEADLYFSPNGTLAEARRLLDAGKKVREAIKECRAKRNAELRDR